MKKVKLLNIEIDNVSLEEILQKLDSGVVLTPNIDHLMQLQTDRDFYNIYRCADYKLCDSQLLFYVSRLLGTPIKEKIAGADFFPAFYTHHRNNKNTRIFLLGGSNQAVARQASLKINHKVGRNIVVGSYSPSFGFENDERECMEIVKMINRTNATVLAVGLGAPKQEKWIHKYQSLLPKIKIFLPIGATINFEAGKQKRAPQWMRARGLEWLHRLLYEPGRLWHRYLIKDLPFFWLILLQKLNVYKMPFDEKSNYDLYDDAEYWTI